MVETPPFLPMDQNPENFVKSSRNYNYPEKAKGMSFFAFVFSTVIYISIFYVFNLSPQILLNNTKFWFFISNTIILIIAADYGAFYFSKENKLTLYDEYVLQYQQRNVAASFVSRYQEIAKEKENVVSIDEGIRQDGVVLESEDSVVKTNMKEEELEDDNGVCVEKGVIEEKNYRRTKSDIVGKFEEDNGPEVEENNEVCEEKGVIEEKTYRRTKSDVKEKIEEEKKICILESSDSECYEYKGQEVEENSEFLNMSDEELNRRAEEFIRKLHRQIRLQGLLEAAEENTV